MKSIKNVTKKVSLIVGISLIACASRGMEKVVLSTIPGICAELVHQCKAEKVSVVTRNYVGHSLVCDEDTAFIVWALDRIRRHGELEKTWGIDRTYGGVSTDGSRANFAYGIRVLIKHNEAILTKEQLKEQYRVAIKKALTGWVAATQKEHENIVFEKNQKEWSLFVNETPLNGQKDLINFLSIKYGMSENKLMASNIWNTANLEVVPDCLWIRKDSFDEVQKTFNFTDKDGKLLTLNF